MSTGTKPTVIHLLPHFHYDTVYLKTYDDYLRDALEHIYEALRIMETEPSYTFMIEQMILVEEYWRRFPEQRGLLRKLAAEGRMEIACGMYCMPDVNLPSGESFMKQVQVGKKLCRELLGTDVRVAWMSDCFGHHPQLPQLLAETGYEIYVFSRGADEKMPTPFRWKGLDGTDVRAHRLHGGYGLIMFSSNVQNALELTFGKAGNEETIQQKVDMLQNVTAVAGHLLLPNGGDMARPQREAVAAVRLFNERYGGDWMSVQFSTVQTFLDAVKADAPTLPSFEGDINPVFQGTYSSRMGIKLKNRELEWKLQAVERLQAVLMLKGIVHQPLAELNIQEAWQEVLYNQFHDIICGTILDEGYVDTMERYKRADRLLRDGAAMLMDGMDDQANDRLIVYVFNPSGFVRQEVIELDIAITTAGIFGVRVTDREGTELPVTCRILESDDFGARKLRIAYTDTLKAMTLSTYRLELTGDAAADTRAQSYTLHEASDGYVFENRYMKLHITSSGGIKHFTCRSNTSEAEPNWVEDGMEWNDMILMRDQGDLWLYDEPILNGAYTGATPENGLIRLKEQLPYSRRWLGSSSRSSASIRIEEEGPDRVILCSTGAVSFWNHKLAYTKRIILDAKGDRVRFSTCLTGTGKQYRVIAAFPTSLRQPTMVQQIPFGYVKRDEGEFPAQNWSRFASGDARLLICNAGIPGNGLEGATAWLALTRSAAMPYKAPSDLAYEEGVTHTYTYEICAQHAEGEEDFADYDRMAEALNMRPITVIRACGRIAAVQGPRSDTPEVGISSFHYCSEQNAWILRLYDASGHGAAGAIHFPDLTNDIISVQEQNAILQPKGEPVSYNHDRGLEVSLGPFQIRTFAISWGQQRTN
ncbi:glycosyl hydrolase-related protein [Bacillus sp. 3255]|uniref:glycoside hydrolase family 38 N-terminal domain-containing protein n=1 Tax=Bacillus sp. 3255 TaxID=2817904 RepID=UPI00285DE4A2|nr:glycosyl hydrolase-related protein [Bacillus sp. 3255]MDR6881276.1 alpha-mannosidase [Bacillus sp. 3255]